MDPTVYTHDQMLQRLCRAEGRPGLYIHIRYPEVEDPVAHVYGAVPLLTKLPESARTQLLADGFGFVFFENVETMREVFEEILGPDGPQPQHTYRGPAHAFVVACDADGKILGDNTESSDEDVEEGEGP